MPLSVSAYRFQSVILPQLTAWVSARSQRGHWYHLDLALEVKPADIFDL